MRYLTRVAEKWGDQRYLAYAWRWGQLELAEHDMITLRALRGSEYHTLYDLYGIEWGWV